MIFSKKKIIPFICFLLVLQGILILHRVNFDLNIFFNFLKKDVAITKSVKNKSAIEFQKFFFLNGIKNFNIDQTLKEDTEFYQRVIEYSLPIKFDKNSEIVISKKKTILNCTLIFQNKFRHLHDCR
tara:strand:- start:15 stop:392 length:378 start_codon:yes stop_codon:yes gene_type:complete